MHAPAALAAVHRRSDSVGGSAPAEQGREPRPSLRQLLGPPERRRRPPSPLQAPRLSPGPRRPAPPSPPPPRRAQRWQARRGRLLPLGLGRQPQAGPAPRSRRRGSLLAPRRDGPREHPGRGALRATVLPPRVLPRSGRASPETVRGKAQLRLPGSPLRCRRPPTPPLKRASAPRPHAWWPYPDPTAIGARQRQAGMIGVEACSSLRALRVPYTLRTNLAERVLRRCGTRHK